MPGAEALEKQKFNCAIVGEPSRGKDTRIVQHKEIPRAEESFLARETADAQSSGRRGAAPSSGSLPVAQAGAAQSIRAAKRNRNRLAVRSSEF